MPDQNDKKPILDPERELPAPHDMSLDPGPKVSGLIEAEEKDGKVVDAKPEQFSETKSQKPSKKKAFPLWLLPFIAFLIIVLAGGMYFLNAQKETAKVVPPTRPTPTVTPTPDPTANWQTFRHDEQGYSIAFPSDGTLSTLKDGSTSIMFGEIASSSSKIQDPTISDGLQIIILVVSNYKKTAEESLSRHVDIKKHSNNISTKIINDKEVYSVAFQFPDWIQYTELVTDNTLYEFRIITRGENQELKLEKANQIISTFKLLDNNMSPSPSISQIMKACTIEAKLCPDGSTVGRTGPNCEFSACPGE